MTTERVQLYICFTLVKGLSNRVRQSLFVNKPLVWHKILRFVLKRLQGAPHCTLLAGTPQRAPHCTLFAGMRVRRLRPDVYFRFYEGAAWRPHLLESIYLEECGGGEIVIVVNFYTIYNYNYHTR